VVVDRPSGAVLASGEAPLHPPHLGDADPVAGGDLVEAAVLEGQEIGFYVGGHQPGVCRSRVV
jgi:hypothetical protein